MWAQSLLANAAAQGDHRAASALGNALLAGGPIGVARDPELGLVRSRVGDPSAALSVFQRLQDQQPGSAAARLGKVQALIACGDEAAALEEATDDPERCIAAASLAFEAWLRRSGSTTSAQLEEAGKLLERHFEESPQDSRALDRLVRHLLAGRQFQRARDLTGTHAPDSHLEALVNWSAKTASNDHTDAHEKKRAFAQRTASIIVSRNAPVGVFTDRVRALNYACGPDAALDCLRSRWPLFATRTERLLRSKIDADLCLLLGDAAPIRAFSRANTSADEGADRLFSSLVAGANVLVVGPSPAHQPSQADIENADVVVTTHSRHLDTPAGQPTITYVVDETARSKQEQLVEELNAQTDHMVVLRPSVLRSPPPALVAHERSRVMPFEDTTPWLGTHFALQRITYDLVASSAGTVRICGVDFFLGARTHVSGYQDPALAPQAFNFSHDYAYGFHHSQMLFRSGFVTAPTSLASLLELSVASYLAALEAARRTPTERC